MFFVPISIALIILELPRGDHYTNFKAGHINFVEPISETPSILLRMPYEIHHQKVGGTSMLALLF